MNYTIIGAGKSGIAAAELAVKNGCKVFLTESKPADGYSKEIDILKKIGAEFEFGGNTERALEADLIIASPGILPGAEIIKNADARGIKIIGELEFGSRFVDNPIISITGTNGKTTTTTLTTYMLNKGGRRAVAAGNIGLPISALAGTLEKDAVIVCETSSFQLDRTENFKPEVAMILNITPDHLYYHGDMWNYSEAKWKTTSRQNEKDLLILNADDEGIINSLRPTKAQTAWFSVSPLKDNVNRGIYSSGEIRGIYAEGGVLILKMRDKEEEIMPISDIRLPGAHNLQNSMAAALAARAFEIRNENIRDSLMGFEGVEHRLESVRIFEGVEYVNDSKATNVNAAWYALSSYRSPIVWIAGGRGDSNDYSALDPLVEKNVRCVVAIGEEADAIFNHYSSTKRCMRAGTMAEAVEAARGAAEPGDVALFSPACKSFDMFMNFEHRGEVFKQAVRDLR